MKLKVGPESVNSRDVGKNKNTKYAFAKPCMQCILFSPDFN